MMKLSTLGKPFLKPLSLVSFLGLWAISCGSGSNQSKTNWIATPPESAEQEIPEFSETKVFAVIPVFSTVEAEDFVSEPHQREELESANSNIEIFVSDAAPEADDSQAPASQTEENEIPVKIIRGNPNPVEKLYIVECTSSKLPLSSESETSEQEFTIQSNPAIQVNPSPNITELYPEYEKLKAKLLGKQKGEELSSALENLFAAQFALQNRDPDSLPKECILFGDSYEVLAYDYARLKLTFKETKTAINEVFDAGIAGGFFFMGLTGLQASRKANLTPVKNAKLSLAAAGTVLAAKIFHKFLTEISPYRKNLRNIVKFADKPLSEQNFGVTNQYDYLRVKQEFIWFMQSFNQAEYERLVRLSAFSKPIEIPEE